MSILNWVGVVAIVLVCLAAYAKRGFSFLDAAVLVIGLGLLLHDKVSL